MSSLIEQDFKEIFNFSKTLQQYYYSYRLEKNTQDNQMGWTCAKFTNFPDAEKFSTGNSAQTVITKIIPTKCNNPFEFLENDIVKSHLDYPVQIIKPTDNQ